MTPAFEISFAVPGVPVPRNSQKVSTKSGRVVQYLPKRVREHKARVEAYATLAMHTARLQPVSGLVALEAVFVFPAPLAGISRAEWARIEAGELLTYPKIRCDLDNALKLIGDALQGIVFVNDKQIVDVHLSKRIGKEPRTEITVRLIT